MTRPWIPSHLVHHHHHLIHDLLPLCSLWLLGTIVQIATILRVALALFDTLLVSFSISVLLVQIHLVCQHLHQCHQSNPVSLCQSDPLMCALQNQLSLNLLLWINLHALYASVSHLIVLHEQWWHYTSTWVKKDTKQSCNHHLFRGTSVALFILVDAGSGYTHKTHAQQTTTTSSFFLRHKTFCSSSPTFLYSICFWPLFFLLHFKSLYQSPFLQAPSSYIYIPL